jgi:hypothetical protein
MAKNEDDAQNASSSIGRAIRGVRGVRGRRVNALAPPVFHAWRTIKAAVPGGVPERLKPFKRGQYLVREIPRSIRPAWFAYGMPTTRASPRLFQMGRKNPSFLLEIQKPRHSPGFLSCRRPEGIRVSMRRSLL